MIDYRYHALSLAAVLFALALGVVIGVATHELLNGRNLGLLFLGNSSNQINSLVGGAVSQAGGQLSTVVALREPLDLAGLDHEASGTHYSPLSSTTLIERLGAILGKQLVSGGQNVTHEIISRVRAGLMSAFDGQLTRLEGLVVMRAEPTGMSLEASEQVAALESGVIAGASAVHIPVVGVELTGTEPSQVSWYTGKNLSSVDDLDASAGQAALVYALTGDRGAFGTKASANSLLPSPAAAAGATP
jgi:hypothetical protein